MSSFFFSDSAADTKVNRFLIGLCLVAGAVALLFALGYVPMNMDEAGIFHALACFDHPLADFNLFREPCYGKNDLTLLGGFHLFRSQFYTGLFHTLLFAPFFWIFHAPYAQYIFGLAFLAAFLAMFSRQTPNPKLSFVLGLAFFPFIFQCVHDTGPVKFHLLMYPLMAFGLRRMIGETAPLRYAYAVALAILCALATEEKAFFVYLFPSALFYALAVASEGQTLASFARRLQKAWGAITAFALVFLLGLAILFSAHNVRGETYLHWLTGLSGNNQMSFGEWGATFLNFQFFWPMYAHYHFDLVQSAADAFVFKLVTAALLLGLGGFAWRFRAKVLPTEAPLVFLLLSYLGLVVVFALMRNTWAGHHFIFLWVPLLFFFASVCSKLPATPRLLLVAGFVTLNIASVLVLTQNKLHVKVDGEKDAIFAYLNDESRAAESIYSFTTWGGFFIQELYGPKTQIAVYTEPYEETPTIALYPGYAKKLLDLSRITGRKLYTICYEPPSLCSKEALETAFADKATFEEVLPGLEHWHLFLATDKVSQPSESPSRR